MMGRVNGLSGSVSWEDVQREDSRICGLTHTQRVALHWRGELYVATLHRFFDRGGVSGKRTTYEVDAIKASTGRRSRVLSDMIAASGWMVTFRQNVQEWADKVSRLSSQSSCICHRFSGRHMHYLSCPLSPDKEA